MIIEQNYSIQQRPTLIFDLATLKELSHFDQTAHSELLGSLFATKTQYDRFIDKATKGKIEALEQEHDSVAVSCREAHAAVVEANLNLSKFLSRVREVEAELSSAQLRVKCVKSSKPKPPFATRNDYRRWEVELTEAQAQVDSVNQKQQSIHMEQTGYVNAIKAAQERLRELTSLEQTLRLDIARLRGETPEQAAQDQPRNEFGLG